MGGQWMVMVAGLSLCAAGLGLCLYLFASAKAELRALAKRSAESRRALETGIGQLKADIEQLGLRLRDVEEHAGMLVPPPPAPSGLNLSKRSVVLRRHRAGEDPAGIAASLGLPQAEVDLLLKVQRVMLERM